MCCYQTFVHLLVINIYLKILNYKERKEVNLLLQLTSWPFGKTCVNSRTASKVLSLFCMHCQEQWECYGRSSILCMLLSKVLEHVYYCLYSSNLSSFFGFVLSFLQGQGSYFSTIICCCYVVDLKFVYYVTLIGSWSSFNYVQVLNHMDTLSLLMKPYP